MLRTTALACALAALPLAAHPEAHEGDPMDQVVASVNGTDITLGHVAAARTSLPEQFAQMPTEALLPGLIDQLIQQEALAQQAEGDIPPDAQRDIENTRRAALAGMAISAILEERITEETARAEFAARMEGAQPQTEWNAAHILVETEGEAQELVTELEGGADFAELAMERSTGPSGPRGGALGWFGPGQMVPEFEQAVQDMEPGDVSAPIQTQFGWHVVKLNELRQQEMPTFEQVAPQVIDALRREAVSEVLAGAAEGAEVVRTPIEEIDASALR